MSADQILSTSFLLLILASGIRLAIPVLIAVIGEIITEKGGVLNLGLEGIMTMGGMVGFIVTYLLETNQVLGMSPFLTSSLGLIGGILSGVIMGLIMSFLAVSLKADQVVSSVMLVLLGKGFSGYMYRQQFGTSHPQVTGFKPISLPVLSDIPVVGEVLFSQNIVFYMTILIVVGSWFLLRHTQLGMNIRAVGENPSAAETSGLNVNKLRYKATIIGSALTGLGGAVLTVAQLKIFTQGINAGRGWVAVALVIFSGWKPSLAVVGALLFGLADAIQYRVQALGAEFIPYEVLLMLPYVLTIMVLLKGVERSKEPEALGQPYQGAS